MTTTNTKNFRPFGLPGDYIENEERIKLGEGTTRCGFSKCVYAKYLDEMCGHCQGLNRDQEDRAKIKTETVTENQFSDFGLPSEYLNV